MVHKNDMSHWDEIGCQRGCDDHPTRTVHVVLGGPTKYRDLTPIPNRLACEFDVDVWDTHVTPVDGGPYCPARDAVSETILSHVVWEPQETTVLMLCWDALSRFSDREALFIDVGSQIGWFSTLAVSRGIRTVAIEADPDVASVCHRNIHRAGSTGILLHERVGPGSVQVENFAETAVVTKIDIEGAERHAIEMLRPLIDAGSLRYILMEMSPVFNDTYPAIAEDLVASGYRMYTLPPKQNPPVRIDHLGSLIPYEVVGDVGAEVASWTQRDVLFALGGVRP